MRVLHSQKVDVRLPGKGNLNSQWREAGPLNPLDDKVDSDQWVLNKELSSFRILYEKTFNKNNGDEVYYAACSLLIM